MRSATQSPVECDCLNWCGDDPWLADGRSTPCEQLKARRLEEKTLAEQATRVSVLMRQYATNSVYDLIEKLHAEVTRLQQGVTA